MKLCKRIADAGPNPITTSLDMSIIFIDCLPTFRPHQAQEYLSPGRAVRRTIERGEVKYGRGKIFYVRELNTTPSPSTLWLFNSPGAQDKQWKTLLQMIDNNTVWRRANVAELIHAESRV